MLGLPERNPVADTLYTRALVRAAEIQGSTQSLASLLRVPENTLLRWMAGRAQMPLQAFLKTIELISADERKQAPVPRADAAVEKLRFKIGDLEAHCSRCDGHEFVQADPTMPLRYINEIVCCACGARDTHGNVIAQLAKDAVYHSKALTVARQKRQAELLKNSPKLRMLRGGGAEPRGEPSPTTEPGKKTTG
jgi:hypothetical protein